jgi:hypothetical protein
MERLLTPQDVAGILQVSKRKAYDLMKGMRRLENPLRVTETSLAEWINERSREPGKKTAKKRPLVTVWRVERR